MGRGVIFLKYDCFFFDLGLDSIVEFEIEPCKIEDPRVKNRSFSCCDMLSNFMSV